VKKLDKGDLGESSIIGSIGLIVVRVIHALPKDSELSGHFFDVLVGELGTELIELLPTDIPWRYAVKALHTFLDGNTVHIEAQGEDNVMTGHSLETSREIDVGVVYRMPCMKGTRRIAWWIIDAVHGLVRLRIISIDLIFGPKVLPLLFQS